LGLDVHGEYCPEYRSDHGLGVCTDGSYVYATGYEVVSDDQYPDTRDETRIFLAKIDAFSGESDPPYGWVNKYDGPGEDVGQASVSKPGISL